MKKLNCYLFCLFLLFLVGCSKEDADGNNTPVVTSIYPTFGWMGDTVTVYGRNFITEISQLDIKVNGKPLSIIQLSSDSIKVIVPSKLGSGPVQLSFGGTTYAGPEFTYNYRSTVTTVAGTGLVAPMMR